MTTLTRIMAKAAEGGYGEDSDVIGKFAGLFMATKFDRSWGPFICGTMGAMGPDGLPEASWKSDRKKAGRVYTGTGDEMLKAILREEE